MPKRCALYSDSYIKAIKTENVNDDLIKISIRTSSGFSNVFLGKSELKGFINELIELSEE